MKITKTVISFHKKADLLKIKLGTSRAAWLECEKEYYELTKKNRYSNFRSFRYSHWKIMQLVK